MPEPWPGTGDCAAAAARCLARLRHRPGVRLVFGHGRLLHLQLPPDDPGRERARQEDLTYWHAWVEFDRGGDRWAVDESGGGRIELPADTYRHMVGVVLTRTYTVRQAMECYRRTGWWAPWHLPAPPGTRAGVSYPELGVAYEGQVEAEIPRYGTVDMRIGP